MKKWLPIGLILLLFVFQLYTQLSLSLSDSQTTDEGIHLSAGYTYWKYHDWRMNPEHPLLVKLLAGFPLYLAGLKEPLDLINWSTLNPYFYDNWRTDRAYGEELLYGVGNNADQVLFLARLPMVGLSVLLGLVILGAAWLFWGRWAAVLAYVVFTLDPNFLAHGHLVTTDIGISLTFLIAILSFWWYAQKSDWKRALLFGLACGLAFASKFTAVILVPVLIVLAIILWYWQLLRVKPILLGRDLLLAIVVGLFTIWAIYGFDTTPVGNPMVFAEPLHQPIPSVFLSTQLLELDPLRFDVIPPFVRALMVPRDFYKGLMQVLSHVDLGHTAYLLGQFSRTGWWYYFPVLVVVKTPIPTLLLFGLAIWFAIKRNNKPALYLCTASAVYLVCAMLSKANLGIRHILPIYPPLILAIGSLAIEQWRNRNIITTLLALWLVMELVTIAPYYISYFNEIAGGTQNGYRVAADSNIEWGQDLKRLRDYLKANPQIQNPYIEYYWDGLSSLGYYGIKHQYLSDLTDHSENRRGYAIIGVSELLKDEYRWLRSYKQIEKITPSLWVIKMD